MQRGLIAGCSASIQWGSYPWQPDRRPASQPGETTNAGFSLTVLPALVKSWANTSPSTDMDPEIMPAFTTGLLRNPYKLTWQAAVI